MTCPSAADTALELDFCGRRVKVFSKIWLQFCYYRVLSKALLGFSVPDSQPSMTAHYNQFHPLRLQPQCGCSLRWCGECTVTVHVLCLRQGPGHARVRVGYNQRVQRPVCQALVLPSVHSGPCPIRSSPSVAHKALTGILKAP